MKKKTNTRPKVKPNYKLDGEDAEMLAALDNGEIGFKRVKNHAVYARVAKEAATNYMKKSARVSFRISEADLRGVKRMAASRGLPYQTFLTGIIHQLTTGQVYARP